MLEIVVCEDNEKYRQSIIENLNSIIKEKNISGAIAYASNSPSKVLEYIDDHMPNVFFLDIDLNADINGIDLAISINEKLTDVYIVFISQYANLVFKSFKVRPFDFLPKPITKDALESVLIEINEDYLKKFDLERPEFLYIKIGSQVYQIHKSDIIFIEKYGNKCIIHSTNKIINCYQSLDTIFEKLANDNFVRCHKSFIVNKLFIEHLDLVNMEIFLTNGEKCFIGGKFKKNLVSQID